MVMTTLKSRSRLPEGESDGWGSRGGSATPTGRASGSQVAGKRRDRRTRRAGRPRGVASAAVVRKKILNIFFTF